MQNPHIIIRSILIIIFIFSCNSIITAQTTKSDSALSAIEIQKARTIIEKIDNQFSKDYLNGDSLAVAAHYATNGEFGSLKGNDILSYWGKSIRNSIKNNTRNLVFTTTTLTGDSEFLVELGIYQIKDDDNNVKANGKYVVVWKNENGEWKIYRDIGL